MAADEKSARSTCSATRSSDFDTETSAPRENRRRRHPQKSVTVRGFLSNGGGEISQARDSLRRATGTCHRPDQRRSAQASWSWTATSRDWKLQRKVNRPGLVPVHDAQVHPRTDLEDLVANVLGYKRGLRVVKHDTFLAIEPALGLVDLGHNRVQSEGEDAVSERPVRRIEGLSLPAKNIHQGCDRQAEARAGTDDGRSLSIPVGNVARRTAGEKVVEFLLGHRQKLRRSVRHMSVSSTRWCVMPDSAVIRFWKGPVRTSLTMAAVRTFVNAKKFHSRSIPSGTTTCPTLSARLLPIL